MSGGVSLIQNSPIWDGGGVNYLRTPHIALTTKGLKSKQPPVNPNDRD